MVQIFEIMAWVLGGGGLLYIVGFILKNWPPREFAQKQAEQQDVREALDRNSKEEQEVVKEEQDPVDWITGG